MREFLKWWLGHTEDELVEWYAAVYWMALVSLIGLLVFVLLGALAG